MRPKEVSEFLKVIINDENAPAVFIWGPPGVGKSNVVAQTAAAAGIGIVDMRMVLLDPSELRGIPVPREEKAFWLPPSALPTKDRGILFLDELNLAPPLVQSSAYQLVLDRKVGEYCLPDGWRVIAAGNKTEHGGNIYKMSPALRTRFIHVDFEVNPDDWFKWAFENGIASEVMEFLSFRPDLLFYFDGKRVENTFPTPRTWEMVSKIRMHRDRLSDNVLEQVIAGTVGPAPAAEFNAYLRIRNSLPPLSAIFAGEDFVPERPDVAYALATALAVAAKPEQFERLIAYSEKLPPEIAALLVRLLLLKNKEAVLRSPSYPAWAKRHSALLL